MDQTIRDAGRLTELYRLVKETESDTFFSDSVQNRFVLGIRDLYIEENPDGPKNDKSVLEWAMTDIDRIEINDESILLEWDTYEGMTVNLESPIVYSDGDWVSTGWFQIWTNEPPITFGNGHVEDWINIILTLKAV